MNPALQVLLAFLAGLGAGIAVPTEAILRAVEPVGTLWINALRMPILPLIVMLTIAGIAKARDTREAGALTGRAVLTFLVLLVVFTAIMTALAPLLLAGLPLDPAATEALRASASSEAASGRAALGQRLAPLADSHQSDQGRGRRRVAAAGLLRLAVRPRPDPDVGRGAHPPG